MKPSDCAIAFGIVAALCWSTPASSATIKSLPGKHGGVVITLSGQIITGDSDAFISEIQHAHAAGKSVENVQLNSGAEGWLRESSWRRRLGKLRFQPPLIRGRFVHRLAF
jgi:hypothetical protein